MNISCGGSQQIYTTQLLHGNLEIMKSFICRNQKFDKAVTIHFANDLANKTSHECIWKFGTTPKLRYNESRYSEFRDIVIKIQLQF